MVGQLARISNLAPSFATSAAAAPSPPASSGFSVSRPTGSKRLEIFVCLLTRPPLRYDREAQELTSGEAEPRISCVRITTFDDLHETGIYSWAYLYCLDVEHEMRWRSYLDGLTENGLSHEPEG
jgi:hypothetical protein